MCFCLSGGKDKRNEWMFETDFGQSYTYFKGMKKIQKIDDIIDKKYNYP